MRLGFLVPTVGTFGAVREMVELSNVWVDMGHEVTIFHPDGEPCVWLPCKTQYGTLDDCKAATLDVLIGIVDWKTSLYNVLMGSMATLKATCLMGFDPTDKLAAILRGDEPTENKDLKVMRRSLHETIVLADGSWQLDWVRGEVGVEVGLPFGGINLQQFHPSKKPKHEKPLVIASGDPRDRKGSDTVNAAIELVKQQIDIDFETYWGKRYTQQQLVEFIQNGDLFLDGHRRAGWCNPVLESMACGTVPICTDIGAVRDFAIPNETAKLVPTNSPEKMAEAAIELLTDEQERKRLRLNGLERVKQFDYKKVAPTLITYFEGRLSG